MSEVLTNPSAGYYTQRDVFGASGDFITSPEISQMFGEMIGIWCVATWEQLGRPAALRLVELGPGRGTLMADLLRGAAPFTAFTSSLEVCLVEVSPVLRRLQWEALGCSGEWDEGTTHGRTRSGVPVSWHRSLDEVPAQPDSPPALYLGHEFLDALPVHQFQRTPDKSWCERLVDEAEPGSRGHLRLVLSRGATPAVRTALPVRLEGLPPHLINSITAIEVSPQVMAVAEALATRVATNGGAALLIDYGRDGPYRDSLVAIKQHKLVGLLEQPGTADLSARVDFDAVRLAARRSGAPVAMHGPITQAQLLQGLGIELRLQRLMESASSEEERDALMAGYERLVGGESSREDAPRGRGTRRERRAKGAAAPSQEGAARKVSGGEGVEGMGQSYKAVCICPEGMVPVVFGGSEQ